MSAAASGKQLIATRSGSSLNLGPSQPGYPDATYIAAACLVRVQGSMLPVEQNMVLVHQIL